MPSWSRRGGGRRGSIVKSFISRTLKSIKSLVTFRGHKHGRLESSTEPPEPDIGHEVTDVTNHQGFTDDHLYRRSTDFSVEGHQHSPKLFFVVEEREGISYLASSPAGIASAASLHADTETLDTLEDDWIVPVQAAPAFPGEIGPSTSTHRPSSIPILSTPRRSTTDPMPRPARCALSPPTPASPIAGSSGYQRLAQRPIERTMAFGPGTVGRSACVTSFYDEDPYGCPVFYESDDEEADEEAENPVRGATVVKASAETTSAPVVETETDSTVDVHGRAFTPRDLEEMRVTMMQRFYQLTTGLTNGREGVFNAEEACTVAPPSTPFTTRFPQSSTAPICWPTLVAGRHFSQSPAHTPSPLRSVTV